MPRNRTPARRAGRALPSGRQMLALAPGFEAQLAELAAEARPADLRADFRPGLGERLADGARSAVRAITQAEPQLWAPEVPDWAEEGEQTAHGFTLVENVALIEIAGCLMARGFESSWSGLYWPGYRDYVAAIEAANRDDRVEAVMLLIDSPGGYVTGCFDATRAMRAMNAANGGKLLIAHASLACSAAQAIAAQADATYAEDGANVGSVGVRCGFLDFAGMMEQDGVRIHPLKSGRLKDMGAWWREPTEEELKLFQAEIDHHAARFYAEVAEGRGLDLAALAKGRGWEAQVFTAGDPPPPDAISAQREDVDLIDGVMSEEAAFRAAQALAASRSPVSDPTATGRGAAGLHDANPATSEGDTAMSQAAKIAALMAKAEKGDAKAAAELESIRALLAESEEEAADDENEAGSEEDEAASDDEDEAASDDDDEEAASDDDDEAASDDDEDEAQARANKVLESAAAKDRPRLAGRLAARVALGRMSVKEALADLKAAGKEASGFRAAASANTPGGLAPDRGSARSGKGTDALLSDAMKRRNRAA